MTSTWTTQEARTIADELGHEGVKAVRLLYADLHGIARGKDLPVASFGDFAEEGVPFCAAVLSTDLRHTPVVAADETYGDLLARPDLETLRIVPWQPEVAWCVADLWTPDRSTRWPVCPRGALVAATERYADLGLTPIAAPELEFFLLERDDRAPRGYRRYVDALSRSYTVGHVSDPRGVVFEMLSACELLGLQATTATHEFSNSQYEITIGHSGAVDAADRGFLLKAAVKEMAVRAGLVATFMGKPFNDQGGSGFHVHLSLVGEDGDNALADAGRPDGLSALFEHFLAGILAHARALAAFLAPTVNAYRRLVPDSLVPTHANWGYDNRLAFVRVPHARGRGTRLEVRAGDGAANAHLIIAALLAAGLDGIQRELQPPVPGDPAAPALPGTLDAALDRVAADEQLATVLGPELVETFIRLKRSEARRFNAWVTDWELDEYVDHL